MIRRIRTCLGDQARPIGLLRHDVQGSRQSASFEYEREWLSRADGFAIDPTLPLVAGPQFRRRARDASPFHGAIADTEPDGWGRRVILRDHAKRRHAARGAARAEPAQPLSDLDFLLAVDDFSRVGALRFQDEEGTFQRPAEPGRRRAPPLVELRTLLSASRAVETNTETAADLEYLRGRATSLGGLRPKCTVLDDDGSLSIGKFPSIADERAVTKGEVLALRLASKAGVAAAEARIVQSDGVPVALIRRFDRGPVGRRLMYVSAATLLGVEADEPTEHSYAELVDALRIHGAAPQADAEELWRRIALSIAITNVDDHLRNHGFLHVEHGRWRLAPAFDVNPFPDRARELKLWISESSGPEASVDSLLAVAPYFRIPATRAKEILGDVERAVAGWRRQGRALGMTAPELDAFADAFEHAERKAARSALARGAK